MKKISMLIVLFAPVLSLANGTAVEVKAPVARVVVPTMRVLNSGTRLIAEPVSVQAVPEASLEEQAGSQGRMYDNERRSDQPPAVQEGVVYGAPRASMLSASSRTRAWAGGAGLLSASSFHPVAASFMGASSSHGLVVILGLSAVLLAVVGLMTMKLEPQGDNRSSAAVAGMWVSLKTPLKGWWWQRNDLGRVREYLRTSGIHDLLDKVAREAGWSGGSWSGLHYYKVKRDGTLVMDLQTGFEQCTLTMKRLTAAHPGTKFRLMPYWHTHGQKYLEELRAALPPGTFS